MTGLRDGACLAASGAGGIGPTMALVFCDKRASDTRGFCWAMALGATAYLDEPISFSRHGQALAIAEAVLYLASDRSSFTTGSLLTADGGSSA